MTLIVSMGWHLALFQTIAWGNMLVDFSSTGTLAEAVQKTFDGKNPCALCKAVEKSKEQDSKKPLVQLGVKMDLVMPVAVKLPVPCSKDIVVLLPIYVGGFDDVTLARPDPPPRAV